MDDVEGKGILNLFDGAEKARNFSSKRAYSKKARKFSSKIHFKVKKPFKRLLAMPLRRWSCWSGGTQNAMQKQRNEKTAKKYSSFLAEKS